MQAYSNWYSCLLFPEWYYTRLSLTLAFSTPAIWCRVFLSTAFWVVH